MSKNSKGLAHQEEEDSLMTVAQVSEYLNIAERTLYDMLAENEFPSIREGKRRFVLTSVAKAVKAARDIYGADWKEYIKFQDEETEDTAEGTESSVESNLLGALKERAERCHAENKFEAASEFYAMLLENLDTSTWTAAG